MKGVFVCLFVSLCIAFVFADVGIHDLDDSNFDSVIDRSTGAFIEFYAPWCGHCKKLAPEYEIVGAAYARFKTKVKVARVDCAAHGELCGRFGIGGYPTLKWFPAGDVEAEPYSGGRTADDIINFINSKTGLKARAPGALPSDVVDVTDNDFNDIVKDTSKDVFVEFYAPWCGHCKSLAPKYEKFGTAFKNEEDVIIARVDADQYKSAAGRAGVTGYPTLIWYPKDNKEGERYSGARELADLVSFVNDKAGTQRNEDGTLFATAGLVAELDALVEKFFAENKSAAVVEEAVAACAASSHSNAKFYKRAFQKVAEDDYYVHSEVARLNRMLEGSSLTAAKVDEFNMRINILNKFKTVEL